MKNRGCSTSPRMSLSIFGRRAGRSGGNTSGCDGLMPDGNWLGRRMRPSPPPIPGRSGLPEPGVPGSPAPGGVPPDDPDEPDPAEPPELLPAPPAGRLPPVFALLGRALLPLIAGLYAADWARADGCGAGPRIWPGQISRVSTRICLSTAHCALENATWVAPLVRATASVIKQHLIDNESQGGAVGNDVIGAGLRRQDDRHRPSI